MFHQKVTRMGWESGQFLTKSCWGIHRMFGHNPLNFRLKSCWGPLGCLARTQSFSDNIPYGVSLDVWPTSIQFLTKCPKGFPRMFGQDPVNFWPNSSSINVTRIGWEHLRYPPFQNIENGQFLYGKTRKPTKPVKYYMAISVNWPLLCYKKARNWLNPGQTS